MQSVIIDLLRGRSSTRTFTDAAVGDELIDSIVESAFQAPTSDNAQACSIVRVSDPATRAVLWEVGNRQPHIVSAPVFLVMCADLARVQAAVEMAGSAFDATSFDATVVAMIDTALVGMAISVAASSVGLGSVMVGAVRNDPDRVADALALPTGVAGMFGIGLGWPAAPATPSRRLPVAGKYFENRYDKSAMLAAIECYEAQLLADVSAPASDPRPWSSSLAAIYGAGRSRRAQLAASLRRRGLLPG